MNQLITSKFKLTILFSCLLFQFYAQTGDDVIVPTDKPKVVYKVWAEVINGDTVPSIRLNDIWIYADYPYKNKKQYEAWNRTKYNVKKVYPYAILAAAKLKEYNRILEKMPNEATRKAYMKTVEKELKAEFEEPLKDFKHDSRSYIIKTHRPRNRQYKLRISERFKRRFSSIYVAKCSTYIWQQHEIRIRPKWGRYYD
jgi:predicted HicB family RNase H-like nuclease